MQYFMSEKLLINEVDGSLIVFDEAMNKIFLLSKDERFAWELFRNGKTLENAEKVLLSLGVENAHEFVEQLVYYKLICRNE